MTIAWVLAIIEPLGICALATMNHNIGIENNVLVREARAAFGAASAAAGAIAWPLGTPPVREARLFPCSLVSYAASLALASDTQKQ